jgi:hypothetical protein
VVEATDLPNGTYGINAMEGMVYIGKWGGVISDFIPSTTLGAVGTDPSGLYYYDNLVNPSSTPELDQNGLVFDVPFFASPMNLCADPGCNLSSGGQTWLIDHVNGSYNFYPVDFSAEVISTPEPSALVLLSLGLVAFTLALARNRWKRRDMAS